MEYFQELPAPGAELALASMDNLGYQTSYGDTRDPFGWGSEWQLLSMAAWYYGDGRTSGPPNTPVLRLPALWAKGVSAHNSGIEPVEPRDAIGAVVPMDRRFFLSTVAPRSCPWRRPSTRSPCAGAK